MIHNNDAEHLKKLEQAALERSKQKADEERRRKLEDKQLKLQRQAVVWDAINTLIALAALIIALFK